MKSSLRIWYGDGGQIRRLRLRVLDQPAPLRPRTAVRGLLVTEAEELLLIRMRNRDGQSWWVTPGGGMEQGEDAQATLRRELEEEVGLTNHPGGPWVWVRHHIYLGGSGRPIRQENRYHLVRVEQAFEPTPTAPDPGSTGFRWWALDDLLTTEEDIGPRGVGEHLAALLAEGPPATPINVDG